jgi:hypothetical protein
VLAAAVFIVGAVLAVGLIAVWEFCLLTDLAQAERVRLLPRWAWAVACLAQIPLGGILYLVFGRVRPRHPTAVRPCAVSR